MKTIINLIYFKDKSENGNFGDELSKFITQQLIDTHNYGLTYNQHNVLNNLVCIGSYIHMAKNNSYIFGSGVRTVENIEMGHRYQNLNVCAVRGKLTREFLMKRNIHVPEIYGDPALLLPLFYDPVLDTTLEDKIGVVPHKSNYDKYVGKLDNDTYFLINPTDKWQNVINQIFSCKYIISSSLHGLICADAYNKPNVWLDEYALNEGDFKFKDYFSSQEREYVKIKSISEFSDSMLYADGNKCDLDLLSNAFPFK